MDVAPCRTNDEWAPQAVFQTLVAHYAGLAMTPGWWDYCRHQVASLEAQDETGLFAGLRKAVAQRIKDSGTKAAHPASLS